jgi:hypothetical protein
MPMTFSHLIHRALLGLLLIAGAQAQAQVPVIAQKVTPKPGAPLQFADIGNVATWRPGGARLIYIKDNANQWYRVDIVEPCMDLFPGKDPTFITLTDTSGTRYSAVVIERHQCDVTKITKMAEAPPAEQYVPPKPKAAAPAKPAAKPAK